MQTCSPSNWEAEAGGMPTGSRPTWCKYWAPGQARALEQDFVQKQRNKHKTPHSQTTRKQAGVSDTGSHQRWNLSDFKPWTAYPLTSSLVRQVHPPNHSDSSRRPPCVTIPYHQGAQSERSQAQHLSDGFSLRWSLVRAGRDTSPASSSRYLSSVQLLRNAALQMLEVTLKWEYVSVTTVTSQYLSVHLQIVSIGSLTIFLDFGYGLCTIPCGNWEERSWDAIGSTVCVTRLLCSRVRCCMGLWNSA